LHTDQQIRATVYATAAVDGAPTRSVGAKLAYAFVHPLWTNHVEEQIGMAVGTTLNYVTKKTICFKLASSHPVGPGMGA
jgi:putative flippase GtrA